MHTCRSMITKSHQKTIPRMVLGQVWAFQWATRQSQISSTFSYSHYQQKNKKIIFFFFAFFGSEKTKILSHLRRQKVVLHQKPREKLILEISYLYIVHIYTCVGPLSVKLIQLQWHSYHNRSTYMMLAKQKKSRSRPYVISHIYNFLWKRAIVWFLGGGKISNMIAVRLLEMGLHAKQMIQRKHHHHHQLPYNNEIRWSTTAGHVPKGH